MKLGRGRVEDLALLGVSVAGLAAFLAPIVLGLGLWRAGRAPWWLPAIWIVATVGFLAVETNKLGDLVGFGSMMGVLAAMALTVLGHNSAPAQTKADENGDPLPAGAIARMGTLRWRHADAVNYVAYTPDGKMVLTAGQDNVIKLWERDSGKEIRRLVLAKLAQSSIQPPDMARPVATAGV